MRMLSDLEFGMPLDVFYGSDEQTVCVTHVGFLHRKLEPGWMLMATGYEQTNEAFTAVHEDQMAILARVRNLRIASVLVVTFSVSHINTRIC